MLTGATGLAQGDDAIALAVDVGDSPSTYCVGKLNSQGCTPEMTLTGVSSATSASGFVLTAESELNQKLGMLLYSVSGPAAVPFQGGTLCLAAPLLRMPAGSSGGAALPINDCSGVYSLDINAFAAGAAGGNPDPSLAAPGTTVWVQGWGRDPGFLPPNNTSLSNGLSYVVGP